MEDENLRINLKEAVDMIAEHQQKPDNLSQEDFRQQIKEGLSNGRVEIVVREIGFRGEITPA